MIITLLTDFGVLDHYVGAMKAVILAAAPGAPIVDLGHEIPPGDVEGGAFALLASYRHCPAGTVHVAVVDPGVGTDRRLSATSDPPLSRRRDAVGPLLVAPLLGNEPIVGHVRGEVSAIDEEGIELRISGALLEGVGGTGSAVHGELRVAVHEPGEELRASMIDVGATGRIMVGGSRASAETLTRARAMGVAGIVLGGILDKELRDFEATQARRRQVGGVRGDFGVVLLEGYGKVGLDPGLFAWFRAHEGRMASLFGDSARVYVYDADPPPARRAFPRPGDRVIAHRRPHAGRAGELVRLLDAPHAAASGIAIRSALVRFEHGPTVIVPLAHLEATEAVPGG